MNALISLIVTTHDRADALDAVLRALSRQSEQNFEVVIADDGSGAETAALIEGWKARLGVPLRQVWQEHRGFRAAEIRNRGVAAAQGGYCIFLDGDCLPRPGFVAAHRRLAEPGWFVAGNRILLSASLTDTVLRDGLPAECWSFATILRYRLRGDVNRLLPALPLPLGALRKANARRWEGVRSCNLAVWRQDLERIDGFDADYVGWGKEDSDLAVRLLHAGIGRKDGRFATGVVHLWHPAANRSALPENEDKLGRIISTDRIRAARGLSALG
jgi:glycosyltransferase involved in cell wall biosynthesis